MIAVACAGWGLCVTGLLLALHLALAQRRRMEVMARACHEIRGPLTAIALGLSLAVRTDGLGPGRLRAMQTEVARAALAVDDLTRVRDAAGGEARTRERVALATLVEDCVTAAEGRARRAGVQLCGGWSGPDVVVYGDRLRLAQALGNVIANAIEHGGGAVSVDGALVDGGAAARLSVADDGPGLPASVQQLARRPRSGRGRRGRGLAIASAIADDHGGLLRTAPSASGGLVVMTLPLAGERSAHTA